MPAEYNEYVLSTSLGSQWISQEQHDAVVTALAANPEMSALDLMRDQQILTPAYADALQAAINEVTQAAPASTAHSRVEVTQSESSAGHVDDYLRMAAKLDCSDLHLGVTAPPLGRQFGLLRPLTKSAAALTPDDTWHLISGFLTPDQMATLQKNSSLEFSYTIEGLGRFRTSVVKQRKGYDAVFRLIKTQVKTMDELGLPESLKILTKYHNGLVLVTGAVGSGKSTTLAAMVEEINRDRHDHIITLEDPIEYLFTSASCQVTQREVHTHTMSFANALRGSLREDPDVIMVGEMRDLETISLAITASETGHLVLGTLHTGSAARTLDRLLDVFPIDQQSQIRTMVSESLRGIISQQLIPRIDGQGRALALEVLVNSPAVANLIREAKTFMLPGVMQTGKKQGMRLMDDSIIELVKSRQISPEEGFDRAEQKHLITPFFKN
jgi:twitching motility protein PilT